MSVAAAERGDLTAYVAASHTAGREPERKIDVVVYKGYEHRCDRRSDRERYSQLWKCRYATKFGCKGKFRLEVMDLNNIEADSVITNAVDHNHAPFSIDSYGLTRVSTLPDGDLSHPIVDEALEQSHAIPT